ncbi:MAG: DUF503 family protein [Calditrichia bacterium]
MKVGIMQVSLYIQGAQSLKEKRMIIRSIKDKIRQKYNVSIDEVDYQDKWQRSVIGISQVGQSIKAIDKNFNAIYQKLLENYSIQVVDKIIEYV